MGDERHLGLLGVEVAGEVEQERLHQQLAVGAVEGRAPPDRDCRRPGPIRPDARTSRRRSPRAGRQMLSGTADVGRGEAEFGAAPVVAVGHLAPDLVRSAQQHGRLGHPTRADQARGCGSTRWPRRRARAGSGSACKDTPSTSNPASIPSPAAGPRFPCARGRSGSPPPPPPGARRDARRGSVRRSPPPSRWPARRRRARPPSGPPRPTRAARASGRGRTGAWAPTPGGPRWTGAGRRSPRWCTSPSLRPVTPSSPEQGAVAEMDAVVGPDGHCAPPGRGVARRQASVTISITGEGYRRAQAVGPTGRPPPSSGGLQHHGRPDPVRVGGFVDGQQPVALVDQTPRARRR